MKPFTRKPKRFFLNDLLKSDLFLLKSKSGINFLLIGEVNKLTPAGIFKLSIFNPGFMNYLAHAYLSFQQSDILLGNMISDYIKGKKQFDYPVSVQKGITLHRAIDHFTDTHIATQELKSFFRPRYRLYAGAFADIVYDHFLANDSVELGSEETLKQFSRITYLQLEARSDFFPLPFKMMFPHMKAQDWLSNYRHTWGIEKSFGGLVRRAAYLKESTMAFEIFKTHYHAMGHCYAAFFPDVKKFTVQQLDAILKT